MNVIGSSKEKQVSAETGGTADTKANGLFL